MAPNTEDMITEPENLDNQSTLISEDAVVISGMSGMFPQCDNTLELMEKLYNKVDMVQKRQAEDIVNHPELPEYYGKLRDLHNYDPHFFRISRWQAPALDPSTRKSLENSFSAIYDAGINPLSLSGSNLGVFLGSSYADVLVVSLFETTNPNSNVMSGCNKAMMANRISYWLDSKGPSYNIDSSCSSAMDCFERAYYSIKCGECDAAIVGGCNALYHPTLTLNLKSAGHLCLDGKTKSFDKNGDGYVRSEAMSIFFLQKAKDAKRIYAEISHVKRKYFSRPDATFLYNRYPEDVAKFFEEFYCEANVSPSDVEYVEAFGSGIAEADGNDLDVIGTFFATSKPIKVGSVKSNMGHTEGASAACAVAKMCLAYHKGQLPANLHYNEPQTQVAAIRDGRVQVVTENTGFNRGLAAIDNYSYTGVNSHMLLKGVYKPKDSNKYKADIPYLIFVSGKDEIMINKMLDKIQTQPIDPELIALLHNIYKDNFSSHTGRSYIILDTNKDKQTVCLRKSFQLFSGKSRPICFLYSGMGSQWKGMGTELLRIPIFAAAIDRCHKVLHPLGVDIVKILTSIDKNIFNNIMHSMLGITAVQIGLTDVLLAIGIKPDLIIGHSMGELGCAYVDGCLTAEETILCSYYRGLVSLETPFIRGSMAAVGLGYKDICPLCPQEICVACHNSANSVTISGPADTVKRFTSELTKRGIFAKEVACSNIAYHSKYIIDAGPAILSKMKTIIKEPKQRSQKWISTSVPQEKWHEESTKYATPEYFTNNLLNPVLFEENAALIPNDAVIIEIAPHGLMKAIIKNSHSKCVNIPLTKRDSPDLLTFFLDAIGKVYQTGVIPKIDVLYPNVEFPVSTETPLLSHLVEWDHSTNWPKIEFTRHDEYEIASRSLTMSIHDDDYKFIAGYVRNGVNEIPEAALLVFVWKAFSLFRGKCFEDMSITFNDVNFHCQVKIEPEDVLRFRISILPRSYRFEIANGNTVVVSGSIKDVVNPVQFEKVTDAKEHDVKLNGRFLYSLLRMKGYSYGPDFQTIHLWNNTRKLAYIKRTDEWITFLDSLLQIKALLTEHDGVSIPKIVKNLSINVKSMRNTETVQLDGVACFVAEVSKLTDSLKCRGVNVGGVIFDNKPRLDKKPDSLLRHEFIPCNVEATTDLQTAVAVYLQLVAENIEGNQVKITVSLDQSSETLVNSIKEVVNNILLHHFEAKSEEIDIININEQHIIDSNLLVFKNLLKDEKTLNLIEQNIKHDSFILTFEQSKPEIPKKFQLISSMCVDDGLFILLKKYEEFHKENATYIAINDETKFSWLPKVLKELEKTKRVILISEQQPYSGLLGFVKHLRRCQGNKLALVVIDDYLVPSFNIEHDIYKDQLRKGLAINVLNKGQWGSYYYLPTTKAIKPFHNMSLISTAVGDLNNLTWEEIVNPPKNQIKISYAGISTRDCQRALGKTAFDSLGSSKFGMDFSGIDNNGVRVMGLVANGAVSSIVDKDQALLWPVPEHWSLDEAATVPLPYVYAFYCLVLKCKLVRNQRVFVTGGAGALGQAVISICLSMDCTVYTTVSEEKKKRFLLRLFPKLKEENILYSRHENFAAHLKILTKGEKCHIVVNCSGGHIRKATFKCVGYHGIIVDVNKTDMERNKLFELSFIDLISYIAADISSIFKPENYKDRKALQVLLSDGIANGSVRPCTRVVYSPSNVSQAFTLLSSNRNRGRVLIRIDDSESLFSNVKPMASLTYSSGIHIVICDRNNLAIELVEHLVRKGAEKVILNLKTDYNTDYLQRKMKSWNKSGAIIETNTISLQTKEGCVELITLAHSAGSVSSIFIVQDYQAINTIDDKIDQCDLKRSFDETTLITANLDTVSKNLCRELNNFVLISISSNNISYEYASSACEKICQSRKTIGLPALILRISLPNKDILTTNDLVSGLDLSTVSSLFNAMDTSLKSKITSTLTINHKKSSESDVDLKLDKILGAYGVDMEDDNLTLEQMHVNNHIIKEMKSEIKELTCYATEELKGMTLNSLKNLCRKIKRNAINFDVGLSAFYSNVETNESKFINSFMAMKTMLTNNVESGFTDRRGNQLIMIPGFNGEPQIFDEVAERLKIRATTYLLGPDLIYDSVPELAKYLTKQIKSNCEMHQTFYIFGYSFGVNIALEVARLLEKEGRTGVVYCLDSSPDALKLQIKAYLGDLSDSELQDVVLSHIFHLATKKNDVELNKNLRKCNSWSEKVQICLKSLNGIVNFSKYYRQAIFETAYRKLLLAKEYEPDFKLNSEIVLMKGIAHPRMENLPEDYNLSKYAKKPVKVFQLKSDHVAAPYDIRVSNIVNKMLDPALLDEFYKGNFVY